MTIVAKNEQYFEFQRTFDAPRSLMFKFWTDTKHLAQWWGLKALPIRFATWTLGQAERCVSRCARLTGSCTQ